MLTFVSLGRKLLPATIVAFASSGLLLLLQTAKVRGQQEQVEGNNSFAGLLTDDAGWTDINAPWSGSQTPPWDESGTWSCSPNEVGNDYMCFGQGNEYGPDSDYAVTYISSCQDDLIATNQAPSSNGTCEQICYILDNSLPFNGDEYFCTNCQLLPNGTVAYDCPHLFLNGNNDCPSRDEFGDCGAPFTAWHCFKDPLRTNATGHMCLAQTSSYLLPASFVENANVVVNLICANDNFWGGTSTSLYQKCGSNACAITSPDFGLESCDYCQLLPSGKFTYDCSRMYPNISCSETDSQGECKISSNILPNEPPDCTGYADWQHTLGNSESDDEGGWILHGIDVTTFNVISDLVGSISRTLLAIAIGLIYGPFMTWHLRKAQNGIPVQMLGIVPADSLAASRLSMLVGLSLPTLLLFMALLIADFSHSIADLGFEAVTVEKEGDMATILSLDVDHRNPSRLLQTSGDPVGFRTAVLAFDEDGNRRIINSRDPTVQLVSAMDLIGRGGSPFVHSNADAAPIRITSFFGVDGFSSQHSPCSDESTPLASMNLHIPLECFNSSMISVSQLNRVPLYDTDLNHVALVPNCTFTGIRQSGIYQTSNSYLVNTSQAKIIEAVFIEGIQDFGTYNSSIFLVVSNEDGAERLEKNISFAPEDKTFARDRGQDWKRGRVVTHVKGVKVGNETIRFSSVVIASGYFGATENNAAYRPSEYRLFAEVAGKCPKRPSGRSHNDLECLVTASLLCERFEEDYQIVWNPLIHLTKPSPCRLSGMDVVWGTGFTADSELMAVVGSLFSRIQPSIVDGSDRAFRINALFGALFALGTLDERPSVITVVRPRINGIYVTFMTIPVILALCCLLFSCTYQGKSLPVPTNSWELMILGRSEKDKIPDRPKGAIVPYPPQPNTLSLQLCNVNTTEKLLLVDTSGSSNAPALNPTTTISSSTNPSQTVVAANTVSSILSPPGGASTNISNALNNVVTVTV